MTADEITAVTLGEELITLEEFVAVARHGARIEFDATYVDRVRKSRALVERFLAENRLVYGVTTGFGDNVTEVIDPADAEQLQRNIVRSHAVSVGEPLPTEVVRAIALMELVGLGEGYSGIRLETLELIRRMLNGRVTPHVPGEGSVGYLAPEAHMALVLLGEGQAWYGDELLPGAEALTRIGEQPTRLGCKEGLSLTNGTHSVTAIAVLATYDSNVAATTADIAASLSVQALKGTLRAYDARLQERKRHPEQAAVAENLRRLTESSAISAEFLDHRLQDGYCLRGIPQIHGGAKRALAQAREVVVEELHSVGDNPVIHPEGEDGVALMGANFDSTYVGIQADSMVNAMTVLAKASERRTDRMVNSNFSELPAFLVPRPGLNSGYMIAQYTAAALTMELRGMAVPASADTVPTSANQEDPVSNAYLAALKAYRAARKLGYVVAIELMCAVQALDLLAPRLPSPATEALRARIRETVPTVNEDRVFHADIEHIAELVRSGEALRVVEDVAGPLRC
ncbi:histidine ammonia-lyase [Streptomyces sp. NBC_01474]|uniref:HAL/PAL/TAL family ammonia-lyase n=1 Tax=unclassified Streptomyces TaxID=2593676 RepID=UPI002DDA7D0B|nr:MULTISPECIES: histidine ammonia-lyase [unclassified Streptomyces]WSD94736.1 histidine ammonia-lyase [Streptomyces sp. NBC_01474]